MFVVQNLAVMRILITYILNVLDRQADESAMASSVILSVFAQRDSAVTGPIIYSKTFQNAESRKEKQRPG
jgi:hypothetical protein